MGRRKIEIQPIVHERNRSVTFLKRKNGLFKKAYELGVLCSVDVAVIIFEERAGHHVKCYQYCSSDIHEIVARQIKHDGERDTKGPSDFSGGNGGKGGDDNGDGDDDEADDDDDVVPSRSGSNKRSRQESSRSGLKLPNDMTVDYHHRSSGIPNLQPPPSLSLPSTSGGLPISTVRTASSGSSIGPHSSNSSTYNASNPIASSRSGGGGSGSHRTHRTSHPSRSPPETHTPVSAGYGYHGHGHAPPSSFRGGYGGGGPGGSNGPGGPSGGPSGGAGGGSGQFPNFYPNQTPPGGYVGLPGEYPRGSGPPSGGGAGSAGRRGFGATFGEGGGMYSHTGGGGGLHPRTRSGDAGQEGPVFDFLDGNSRNPSNPNSAPGFGLEWPGAGSGGAASGGGPPPPPPAASSANPNSSGGGDWFELLSSAPNSSVQARDTKLSWERGGGSGGLGGAGGGSNDRHSMPSSANGGGVSRSPSVSSSSFSVGGHAGQMGGRGSMDMSIGMAGRAGGGGGSSNMDVAMGGMGMAGASRDGVGVVGKVERRD